MENSFQSELAELIIFIQKSLPSLTGNQFKIFLHIWLQTQINERSSIKISYNQFNIGTGLSKQSIRRAVKELAEKEFIAVLKTKKKSGFNSKNIYKLNKFHVDKNVLISNPGGNIITPDGNKMSLQTVDKHSLKTDDSTFVPEQNQTAYNNYINKYINSNNNIMCSKNVPTSCGQNDKELYSAGELFNSFDQLLKATQARAYKPFYQGEQMAYNLSKVKANGVWLEFAGDWRKDIKLLRIN